MRKFITLATAGLFLLSLQGARAQQEVEPPAVPPMLEDHRPLAHPETKEPAPPKATTGEKAKAKPKAKSKVKAGKKAPKMAKGRNAGPKKSPKIVKKKVQKPSKKPNQ